MDEKKIAEVLREKGLKVTPQRLAVYQALAGTTEHPSAETIFQKLRVSYPTMSLATVYKTIEVLKEIGLVQALNVGEDSFRYDANVESHPHVQCVACHRVDDIFDVDDASFVEKIKEKTPYRLTGQQFYFFGLCPGCARKH